MDYLLGLDIGTSSVKVALMSVDGKIENVKTKKFSYFYDNGFKVMNADDFCNRCFSAIYEIVDELHSNDCIKSVCVSGAGGNLLLIKDGKPGSYVLGWQNEFDVNITEQILSDLSRESVYKTVGWPKLNSFPLSALAYLKSKEPERIENADMVCMHIEYLVYLMSGKWGNTSSMATTFYLQNQEKRVYSRRILDLLGINTNKLPPIVDNCSVVGYITEFAAKKTGLKSGTPVVCGTFDHPSAARGTGVFDENQVMISCGTSWVVFVPYGTRDIPLSKNMLVDPFMSPDGNWCGMKSMASVSDLIEKYKKRFLGYVSYEEFDALAENSVFGCNGLVISDENTDVSYYNKSDVARAIMECIARKLCEFFDELDINASVIKLVGGISNSKTWCKVISEVTGRTVSVTNGEHAGAIGSAIMAGVGVGIFKDEKSAYNMLNFA